MNEEVYWVWLTTTLGSSSPAIPKILYKLTPRGAYALSREALGVLGFEEKIVDKLSDKSLERAERIVEKCREKNIKIVHSESPEYPTLLHRLKDKPHVIYVRGDITCLKGRYTSAFIGTRKMSERGREHAERVANSLINEGYLLVSGIAEGIDSVAAKVSLSRGEPTVAVLGVDIDKYFPKINEKLIDRVAETGAVISEYPPDTNARYFPSRNRIIVGLSHIVNVIEAPVGSGALIAAKLALKRATPTFALNLPGDNFEGCRQLIALGAEEIEGSIASTQEEIKQVKSAEIPDEVQGTRRYIWEKLLTGEQSENSLVDAHHPIAEILCALTELELDGYIKALPGGKYALKQK
ncbi:MAG: DNA-processing protein DprA [Clostridia bacterium]|nr:DNA-processing protein DprA [Clostridia bacterium]